MIEFGKTLTCAREAKGYTVSQIADMTHLKSSIVEQLEAEDFSSIAAPIYGRGFVKLYCEAVGLDPKPLVDEFMAIVNGEREVLIKERPVETASTPAEDTPLQTRQEAAPAPEPDLFQPEATPPSSPQQPGFEALPAQTLSRYAAPIRENPAANAGLLPFNPRILVLAGCACAVLIVLILGIRALYRTTTSSAAGQAAPASVSAESTPTEPSPAPTRGAPRAVQQKIPSLYID